MRSDFAERKARKEAHRTELSLVLRKSREEAGETQREVADRLGESHSAVCSMEDPRGARALTIHRVRDLHEAQRRALAAYLLEGTRYQVTAREGEPLSPESVATLHSAHKEFAELASTILGGLADGVLEDSELEQIEREARDAEEVAVRVRTGAAHALAARRRHKAEIAGLASARPLSAQRTGTE